MEIGFTLRNGNRYLWCSPDIIPYQRDIPQKDSFTSEDAYELELGKDILVNEYNYLYVRAMKTTNSLELTCPVKLYWSEASILQHPKQWLENSINTDTHEYQSEIIVSQGSSIGVTNTPFTWNPNDNNHKCLIAVLGNQNIPEDLIDNQHIDAFTKFILESHGQIAWRNVSFVKKGTYHLNKSVLLESLATDHEFVLSLDATKMPIGTEIYFNCRHEKLDPQINYEGIVGENDNPQTHSLRCKIPAELNAFVEYGARSNNPIPAFSDPILHQERLLSKDDELANFALEHRNATSAGVKDMGDHVLIPIGSHTTIVR